MGGRFRPEYTVLGQTRSPQIREIYKMRENKNKHLSYPDTDKLAEERFWKYKDQDPFPNIAPALLNSADIADYVAHTGMIFPFDSSRLGPASYEMILGGEYLYWDENGKKCSCKDIKKDDGLVLRKNSITYVSVRETFRIPNYIALRFNLRVKHVHRGLLLGTGPLVDPGFHGKLMIPIHNLTNNEYTIKPGEDLISVEFTKVSPNPDWKLTDEEIIETKGQYVENSGKNSKKSFKELLRKTLPFGVCKVMSSLAGTLAEARKQISILSKYKNIAIGVGIAGVFALVGVVATTVGVISDANKYVSDAVMLVKKNDKGDLDIRNFAVRGEVNSLKSEITQLADEIELIKDFDGSDLVMRSDVDALKTELIRLREEINRLKEELRVSHEGAN